MAGSNIQLGAFNTSFAVPFTTITKANAQP
jgi:hypothetical protein